MSKANVFSAIALLALVGAACQPKANRSTEEQAATIPPQPKLQATMETNLGTIRLELFGRDAPRTVANFQKLANSGFYDGTRFHRVIKGFMIQGGDPLSRDAAQRDRWGTGGPDYQFDDEINAHALVRGSLAMANSGPNTNGSQFFVVTADATAWLDGKHTNFGRVIAGREVVERIGALATDQRDRPTSEAIITRLRVHE